MAKNKNRAIKIENEQVENVRAKAYIETELDIFKKEDSVEENMAKENTAKEEIVNEKIENTIVKEEKKKTGTVISVSKFSITVKDENGNGYRLFNRPEAKYGDVIEF